MPPDKMTKEMIEFLESQAIIIDAGVVEINPEAGIVDSGEANGSPADVEYVNGLENLIVVDGPEETPDQSQQQSN